jgi:PAS domain S-box-containing protein
MGKGNAGRPASNSEYLAKTMNRLPVGVCVLDAGLRPVYANPAMEQLTGYDLAQLHGSEVRSILRALIPHPAALARRVRTRVLSGGQRLNVPNVPLRRRDGVRIVCNLIIDPLPAGEGERPDLLCTAIDVTEQDALLEQMLATQKMEALTRMAGGIAHDFNNILGGVLGYASLLRQKLEGAGPLEQYVGAIEDSAWRASELTHQMLAFAREGHLDIQPVSLNELVRDAVTLVEQSLPANVTIVTQLADHPLPIDGEPARIRQVVVNLLTNARDAVAGNGQIHVCTDRTEVETDDALAGGSMRSPACRVVIRDNGRGMPQHVSQRIFEPFFSTREDGERLGMGLSVVYGIVKAHGGDVRVESAPGEGTTVAVHFPAGKSAGPAPDRKHAPSRLSGGKETILVVDDEHLIRMLARDVLGAAGYEVLAAADGSEGLALMGDRGDDIALVIMDLVMPNMSGVEAFDAMRRTHPGVRCLFSSGYGADGLADRYGEDPAVHILPKPFDARSLCAAVRNLLDANI